MGTFGKIVAFVVFAGLLAACRSGPSPYLPQPGSRLPAAAIPPPPVAAIPPPPDEAQLPDAPEGEAPSVQFGSEALTLAIPPDQLPIGPTLDSEAPSEVRIGPADVLDIAVANVTVLSGRRTID